MTEVLGLTPDDALAMLLEGNQRFVAGVPEHPNQDAARRAETAPAQSPFAVLFGCSDQGLGPEGGRRCRLLYLTARAPERH